MAFIIKTLALDVPKGFEVVSTVQNGEGLLLSDGEGIGLMELPEGQ